MCGIILGSANLRAFIVAVLEIQSCTLQKIWRDILFFL